MLLIHGSAFPAVHPYQHFLSEAGQEDQPLSGQPFRNGIFQEKPAVLPVASPGRSFRNGLCFPLSPFQRFVVSQSFFRNKAADLQFLFRKDIVLREFLRPHVEPVLPLSSGIISAVTHLSFSTPLSIRNKIASAWP